MKPVFNWIPIDVIQKIFQLYNQHAHIKVSLLMKKTYSSTFRDLNVKRRNELVATETIYCDTYEIDDSSKCAQAFVGTKTLVFDVHVIKSDKKFVKILEYNIRKRGAIDKLISGSAKSEISLKINDMLRAPFSDDWKSEADHKYQNFSKRRHQTIKRHSNTLLNRTRAHACT